MLSNVCECRLQLLALFLLHIFLLDLIIQVGQSLLPSTISYIRNKFTSRLGKLTYFWEHSQLQHSELPEKYIIEMAHSYNFL